MLKYFDKYHTTPTLDTLKIEVKALYKDFRYILDSNELHEDERKDFNKYIDIDYDDKKINLENSIKFL